MPGFMHSRATCWKPTWWMLCLALGGCGDGHREEPSPWVRIDLWRQPTISEAAGTALDAGTELDGVRVSVPLATATPAGTVERRSKAVPGVVRALRIPRAGSLRFNIRLEQEPYVSFRPLVPGDPACPTIYRVKVRAAGGDWTVVADHRPEPGHWPAPAAVAVDLGAFAGREIELALESAGDAAADAVCGPRDGLALWGSPAVYYRRSSLAGSRRQQPRRERPDVILLSFDAMRADALGSYGRVPSVTPALDALALESDVWVNAFTCFNGTNPSFASVMTGLFGKRHGVYDLRTPLPEEHQTLAEILHRAGYVTGAILSARHLRHGMSGLGQGFDSFDVAPRLRSAELAVDLALDWIDSRRRPFFLWLHLFDPHTPHTPPRPYALGRAPEGVWGLRPVGSWFEFRDPGPVEYRKPHLGAHEALYAGEVAYLDRQVDRLLGFLRSRGMLAETLLAVTSDHGENLLEHGLPFRHSGLWDSTTRIPLILRWPGPPRRERRLPGFAQIVDLFPTILAAAGLAPPASDGRDLSTWTEEASSGRSRVWAEHMNRFGAMVRTESYLYMRLTGHPRLADGGYLYDLRRDPAQEHNVAATRPEVAVELDELLGGWLAEAVEPAIEPQPLDPEQRNLLRALGYLDG